jgi:hypothetical protein
MQMYRIGDAVRTAGVAEDHENYDEGTVSEIIDAETVTVAWQSGVSTPTPVSEIELDR